LPPAAQRTPLFRFISRLEHLGRKHRNFSLKRASVRACWWISPAANRPRAGSELGQGWGPGRTVSPPRCPGPRSACAATRGWPPGRP
jgi:hypothetical protein